jgi:dTDP-4-amino-4,6-dideoxygalactose transaminase
VVRVQTERVSLSHRQIFEALREAGIGVNVHYIPVHLQPYYRALGFKAGDFPQAEAYYGQAISLPMYPAMTNEQQDEVIKQLKRLLLADGTVEA